MKWFLAVPHYLVLAVFAGGTWHTSGATGLLVLFAMIALLFTGRYPRGIFDLVMGMNRWALRVVAYTALMTDKYPPFRLDMGATEPAAIVTSPGVDR